MTAVCFRHLVVLSAGLCLVPVIACQPPSAGDDSGDVMLEGELEIRIVDYFDGSHEERYLLRPSGGGRPLRLHLAEPPGHGPGTPLRVWGRPGSERFAVTSLERRYGIRALPEPKDELSAQALQAEAPPAKRRMAFVLVDLGEGVNITVDEARRKAFGTAPGDQSMKQVLQEYSFGRQDLEGDVIGPIKATMQGCDEDGLADSLRAQVPDTFDHVLWYLGKRVRACGWAGVAPLGRPTRVAGELWVNGTAVCAVATHEFGHNLGLQHAARLTCGGAVFNDVPAGNCRSEEYGDDSDVMGDGCNHINGYSKSYLSWFDKCSGAVVKQTGTFTLFPVERACGGLQVLHVPMPKERRFQDTLLRNYYLELRAPVGLDTRLPPQIQLRVGAAVLSTTGGKRTFFLDANPATRTVDGLKAGQTFEDPAGGLRFKVDAVSAAQATVTVEIDAPAAGGPPTCLDGTALTAPGPASCSNASVPSAPVPPLADGGASASDATAAAPDAAQAGAGGSGAGTGGGGTGGTGGRSGSAGINGSADAAPASPPELQQKLESGCGCDLGAATASSLSGGAPPVMIAVGLVARVLRRRRQRLL